MKQSYKIPQKQQCKKNCSSLADSDTPEQPQNKNRYIKKLNILKTITFHLECCTKKAIQFVSKPQSQAYYTENTTLVYISAQH